MVIAYQFTQALPRAAPNYRFKFIFRIIFHLAQLLVCFILNKLAVDVYEYLEWQR